MTTGEKKEGYSWWVKLLLISGVTITVLGVLLLFFIPIYGIFLGEGAEYSVTCDEYDGSLRTEWLVSDNITGYEDIPENQKENLSNDTRETLKRLSSRANSSYNATNYTELSDEQKEVFREAVDEIVVVDNHEKTPYVRVVYQDVVYYCDTDIMPD